MSVNKRNKSMVKNYFMMVSVLIRKISRLHE